MSWFHFRIIHFVSYIFAIFDFSTLMSVLHCYLSQGNFNTQNYYEPVKYVYETKTANRVLLNHKTTEVNQAKYFSFWCYLSIYLGTNRQIWDSIYSSLDCTFSHILFLDSACVYRPFVLIQLICNTILMIVSVFYFDLVCKCWWLTLELFSNDMRVHISNGITLTSPWLLCWRRLQLAFQICSFFASLGNWQPNASKWCPIVFTKWNGTLSQMNCRSISFLWLWICRNQSIIMDSMSPNWNCERSSQ